MSKEMFEKLKSWTPESGLVTHMKKEPFDDSRGGFGTNYIYSDMTITEMFEFLDFQSEGNISKLHDIGVQFNERFPDPNNQPKPKEAMKFLEEIGEAARFMQEKRGAVPITRLGVIFTGNGSSGYRHMCLDNTLADCTTPEYWAATQRGKESIVYAFNHALQSMGMDEQEAYKEGEAYQPYSDFYKLNNGILQQVLQEIDADIELVMNEYGVYLPKIIPASDKSTVEPHILSPDELAVIEDAVRSAEEAISKACKDSRFAQKMAHEHSVADR